MWSITRPFYLCILVGSVCFIEGVILSMPPVLYPEEARKRSISLPMVSDVKLYFCFQSTSKSIQYELPFYSKIINFIKLQYTSVFGVEPLASFLFAPLLLKFGKILGTYRVFNLGNFAHSFCSLMFGLVVLVQNATIFLFLSYIDRQYVKMYNNHVTVY